MGVGADGGVPVNLPAWASPRIKHPTCECDLALPAIARIHAAYRPFLPAGGRGGSTSRFYDMTFTYDVCRVCVVYEREIRGEISFKQAERWAARYAALYATGTVALPPPLPQEPPKRYARKTCDTCNKKRKWMTAGETTCYGCRRKRAKERAA
jgi:hypothetical protein